MKTAVNASYKRITDPANRLGLIGAGVIIATLAFGVYQALPIVKSINSAGGAGDGTDGADAILKFASTMQNDANQINGRSFFFDPPPPPPPPQPRVERPEPPPSPPPGPPPPPSSYGGPKVVGTVFDTVWLDNNKTMRVGGPVENEMRIISISTSPYVVRIEWKKVEFDVPFLPRDSVVDKSRPAPPPDLTPPTPAPTTPATTPPATTPAPATTPTETKDEKKEEPKPAEAPKPAGESPTPPPEKKDGST